MLILTTTSCTSDDDPSDSATDGCEQTLGESGVKWIESHTGGSGSLERGGMSLQDARDEYNKQMDSWDPDGHHWASELCTLKADSSSKGLKIEFGPSSLPFDFQVKSAAEGVLTPVNSAVRLHQVKDSQGVTQYGVYVKCKVLGNPSEQESLTPLAGLMTDTLTSGTSARDHMTYLLRSARAMADVVECRNKPTIPTEPPASVR
ncbi:hypothetical protein [Streptomyces sp. NPDC058678]|uniref:hypothetical protein n=1 Tax=Streptomyces sp. NPDC058678 TaxID=3346595 RepID=UPI00365F8FB5